MTAWSLFYCARSNNTVILSAAKDLAGSFAALRMTGTWIQQDCYKPLNSSRMQGIARGNRIAGALEGVGPAAVGAHLPGFPGMVARLVVGEVMAQHRRIEAARLVQPPQAARPQPDALAEAEAVDLK